MTTIQEPGPDATMEEIRAYAASMRQQAAQLTAALATSSRLLEVTAANSRGYKRKPELPPWDPKNIEAWIRRVKAAYTRAGISDPAEMFAFLESIIPVDTHPSINAFFNNPATTESWTAFTDFLTSRYGRTKEQQTKTAIDGIERDGRTPSDLMALMHEQMGKITLDDIKKEHLMRRLPPSVRQALGGREKELTADETAKEADAYFDREGTLLNPPSTNAINEVEPAENSIFGEDPPVNAVNPRQGRNFSRQRGPNQPQPANQQRHFTPAFGAAAPRDQSAGRRRNVTFSTPATRQNRNAGDATSSAQAKDGLCHYHHKFGDAAWTCKQPCNFVAGNARGGRQ